MSDGTPEGTRRLADLNPGAGSSEPRELTEVDGGLVFAATDSEWGRELHISDGTPAGTRRLRDIAPGDASSDPYALRRLGGLVYFRADDGVHGDELWRTDGTTEGTRLVLDIRPGPGGSGVEDIAVYRDHLVLRADDGVHGPELWISDGTPAGTRRVRDIRPGPRASLHPDLSFAGALTRLGDSIVAPADDGVHGSELWIMDGTPVGTRLLGDLRPGPTGSRPREFTVVGDRMFFVADDGGRGTELWVLPADLDPRPRFRRGETNGDGRVDISDALAILGTLFLDAGEIECRDAADVNDTGAVDISDAVFLLRFLFLGGPPPPDPSDGCGVDPTGDDLGCEHYGAC